MRPKVGANQHAQVARSLYSLKFEWRNQRVRARADSSTVRFYDPVSHEVVTWSSLENRRRSDAEILLAPDRC